MIHELLQKPIRQAILEELPMYWEYAAVSEGGLPRYQLRAHTGHSEQGTLFSRRLWMSDSECKAMRVHMNLKTEGIPQYPDWRSVPACYGAPCVVGDPATARAGGVR